jgi:hypothetical protein
MNWHLLWLWLWFLIGASMYWLKRAYYMVSPPNPVANNYAHFIQRAWAPLLVRFFADSMIFWTLFTPGFADKLLAALGWQTAAWAVDMVTQIAVFAAIFGFFSDSVADIAISKIPWVKDVLPQMPGPLSANVNATDANLADVQKHVDAAAQDLHNIPPAGGN